MQKDGILSLYERLNMAIERKKTGIGSLAIVIFTTLIILAFYKIFFVNSADYYCGIAAKLFNEGKDEEALDQFNKALEVDPNYGWAYIGRGMVYSGMEEFDRCIGDITRGLNLLYKKHDENFNEFDRAYLGRGEAYYTMGLFDKAIADYEKSIEINPDFVVPYGMCGMAYQRKGDYQKAIFYYDKALILEPDLVRIHFIKAKACEHINDYENAIDAYKGFIQHAGEKEIDRVGNVKKRIRQLEEILRRED